MTFCRWQFQMHNIFKENFRIFRIPLRFVSVGPIDNKTALDRIMAWCRSGDKSIPAPMFMTHIGVTQPLCTTQRSGRTGFVVGVSTQRKGVGLIKMDIRTSWSSMWVEFLGKSIGHLYSPLALYLMISPIMSWCKNNMKIYIRFI